MDFSSFTVKKLQQLSRKEGLPTKGSKQELIDGLERLQKPAAELVAAELPKEVILPPAAAPPTVEMSVAADPASVVEMPIAPLPARVVENLTSEAAAAVRSAPALRTSSRIIKPRICTNCVGCYNHPTHIAGKMPRKAVSAVVDDASITDLAEKFATVNIIPEQQQDVNAPMAAATTKPSAKASKPRTKTAPRAPLQAKSNQATEEVAAADAGQIKAAKGKSTTTKKKVASMKALDAATGNGKENLPTGIEEAKVTTVRPSRRTRTLKQATA